MYNTLIDCKQGKNSFALMRKRQKKKKCDLEAGIRNRLVIPLSVSSHPPVG